MEDFTTWLDDQVSDLPRQEYLDFIKEIRSTVEILIEAAEQEIEDE